MAATIEPVSPHTLLCAINAYRSENYLDLDHPASIAGLVDPMTPEIALMKKSAMMALSEDAQWVIGVIIGSSDTVWHRFTNDTGRFLKENLNRYLHDEHKWTWTRIWRVMAEIRGYVNEME